MGHLILTDGAMRSINNNRSILGATLKTTPLHPAQEKAIKAAIRIFSRLIEGEIIHGKRGL